MLKLIFKIFFPKKNFIFIFSFFYLSIKAQDPQFSQPYNAPLYLNPALTGATQTDRLVFNYRNQWPRLAGTFVTSIFSYDHNFEEYHSGLGILATVDKVGIGGFNATTLSGLYSYYIPMDNDWIVRGGLQFTYANRNVNFYELTFNDQIKDGSFTGSPTIDNTGLGLQGSSVHFFDFSTGFIAYNKKAWFGISANHLTRPNQSLYPGVESKLPIKLSIQTGIKIALNPIRDANVSYIIPSILYRKQDIFQQIDFNLSYQYDPIFIGIGYRGFPFQNITQGYYNQDALILTAGYKFEGLQFYYSHDVTLSKLNGTGGSNEIGLMFNFTEKKVRHSNFINFPFYMDTHR